MRPQAHVKAYKRLEKEGDRWTMVLYSSFALALFRHWNMKKTAILRLIDVTWTAWRECATDYDKSMIKMCEEITGIEIRNGDGAGWRDVSYLNGKDLGQMSDEQWLYMRQQQIKWLRPNIMACILIGLNRKYGFGLERCNRIYQQIQDIEAEFKDNEKRLMRAAKEETGLDMDEIINRRTRPEQGG